MKKLIKLVFLAILYAGCGHSPQVKPPVPVGQGGWSGCLNDPGIMSRDPDHKLMGVASCYYCTAAQDCSPHGNDWCCHTEWCSECTDSPVDFDNTSAPDGGAPAGNVSTQH